MTETELNDNCYNRRTRRDQPRLKLWHSAGLMLTYWCSSRCACCYVYCGPEVDAGQEPMTVGLALSCWQSVLKLAGPRGKVHITGGEPFYRYDRIKEILQAACDLKLSGLEKIETNGYWCTGEQEVRQRLVELDGLGLTLLQLSTDVYHQEYIPLSSVQLCYRVAREVLGEQRVRIRWREFFDEPVLLGGMTAEQRDEALRTELRKRPERMVGRAAHELARLACQAGGARTFKLTPLSDLADLNCSAGLLGAGHVHIDAAGRVFSGTCAGIILCVADDTPDNTLYEQWKRFDPEQHPIWSVLIKSGPAGLARMAAESGFIPAEHYAGKCHLCFEVRRFLFSHGLYPEWLGPAACYGS